MPFDMAKFEQAKFEARRSKIKVEALASFFGEGEEPLWEVRGLNANELNRALEAKSRQATMETIVKALASGGDQAQAIRSAIGLTKDTPGEVAKRLEMLVLGSVAPTIDLPNAVKLAEAFPIEFLTLTNEVSSLTGQGADIVKPGAASPQITDLQPA